MTTEQRTHRIVADTSGHGLPIGATVTRLSDEYVSDWMRGADWYTQGGDGDEVAICPADLVVRTPGCCCAHYDDGSVGTSLCPLHADQDPCLTMAQVTGRRRTGTIRRGVCTSCGHVDEPPEDMTWREYETRRAEAQP